MYILKTNLHVYGNIDEKNLNEINEVEKETPTFKILGNKIVQCAEYLGIIPEEIINKIWEISAKQENTFILEDFEEDAGLNYTVYLKNKTKISFHFDTLCGIEKSADDIFTFINFSENKNVK